jgi:hypothetical protein
VERIVMLLVLVLGRMVLLISIRGIDGLVRLHRLGLWKGMLLVQSIRGIERLLRLRRLGLWKQSSLLEATRKLLRRTTALLLEYTFYQLPLPLARGYLALLLLSPQPYPLR